MGREHELVERTVRGKRREFPAELVAEAKNDFFFKMEIKNNQNFGCKMWYWTQYDLKGNPRGCEFRWDYDLFIFLTRVSLWILECVIYDLLIFSLSGPPGAHPYRVPCIVTLFLLTLLAICPQSSAVAWLGVACHGCHDFAGKLCCGWLAGWYQPGRRIPSSCKFSAYHLKQQRFRQSLFSWHWMLARRRG